MMGKEGVVTYTLRYCKFCGLESEEGSKVCEWCGRELEAKPAGDEEELESKRPMEREEPKEPRWKELPPEILPEVVPLISPEERAALPQTILAGLLSGLGYSIIYWIALIIRGAPGIFAVPFGFLYLAIGGIIGAILGLFNATEYRDGIFAGAITGFAFGLAFDLFALFFLFFGGIPGSGWGWLAGPFIGSSIGFGTAYIYKRLSRWMRRKMVK